MGHIEIDTEKYIISIEKETKEFLLKNITNIKLKYRGYKGGFLSYSSITWIPDNGRNNMLSFYYEGVFYEYELFLENRKQMEFLKKAIKIMKGKFLYP
ncbi:MAG: hypothetical protein IPO21_00340 [Bacteroidales bacterium]|nr:hypothetical protein [Bacteroidales bacterium]